MTPIVIAFTPNYFVPAAVTLQSISQSSSSEARYEVICLVNEDIPERQKGILDKMLGDKMSFRYVNLSGKLQGAYVDPRYSEAASYRLLLPEILPDYDMIAYIDCDVVARNDIADLYNSTCLGDKLLAAVYEAPIEGQAMRWEAIGCDPERYFNSGFLLMNLKQMRKERTSARLMEELHTDYLEFPDQDVLNKVCRGRVFPLHPVYNSIRTFFLPQYKADFLKQYSEDDWDEVQNHGTIHYTGGKPWATYSVRFKDWWQCYSALPAGVKEEWDMPSGNRMLHFIGSSPLLRRLMALAQDSYRKIKYR